MVNMAQNIFMQDEIYIPIILSFFGSCPNDKIPIHRIENLNIK